MNALARPTRTALAAATPLVPDAPPASRHAAIVGGGMAGIVCARTLLQAGWRVTLLERQAQAGGRMSTRDTLFGGFDEGAQYFTVRDARFEQALREAAPGLARPWSATAVRVLDEHGRVTELPAPKAEAHWVGTPGMDALPRAWAAPLHQPPQAALLTHTQVTAIERDALRPGGWQLRTLGHDFAQHVHAGFDAVLLALPVGAARALLEPTGLSQLQALLQAVQTAPCWTLLAAFPQAMQPGLITLGPQWNAARSTHHRVAWLARESSKPGRQQIERWVIHASAQWSQEHARDGSERVQAKLLKAFAEITGIRATPAFAAVRHWPEAQTTAPLGSSHLWRPELGIGLAGDWCLGKRVEDAFVSGLELALAVHRQPPRPAG